MKETLISFETAKLAHEKGYTREVVGISFTSTRRNYYNAQGELNGDCTDFIKDVLKYGREKAKVKHILYPATSQSLLRKWLYEKHTIWVQSNPEFNANEMMGINVSISSWRFPFISVKYGGYDVYEGLEMGLQEALKLI